MAGVDAAAAVHVGVQRSDLTLRGLDDTVEELLRKP
jgi:hypothetical protein